MTREELKKYRDKLIKETPCGRTRHELCMACNHWVELQVLESKRAGLSTKGGRELEAYCVCGAVLSDKIAQFHIENHMKYKGQYKKDK